MIETFDTDFASKGGAFMEPRSQPVAISGKWDDGESSATKRNPLPRVASGLPRECHGKGRSPSC